MSKTEKNTHVGITDEQLKKLKTEVAESLSRDRHSLLIDMPFIGNVAMRFNLVPIRDARVRTACMDYRNIYFDISFYSSLTKEERVFVMAHEVWHGVALSSMRRQTRDAELWNIASDMEINSILSERSSGLRSGSAPDSVLFPPDNLKGESAETIYEWVIRQQKAGKLNSSLSGGSGKDGSSGKGSSSGKVNDGGGNGTKKASGKNDSRDRKDTGRLEGQFDRHEYGDSDESSEYAGGVSDQWGPVGRDPDFKPSLSSDVAERMREAAVAAAQACQRSCGELPAGVEAFVGKLAKPQVSWRDELARFVTSCYGGGRQWLPPNRRRLWNDSYSQSRRSVRINIAVAVDTSGSTSGDLPQFFGELKGLVAAFDAYDIHLIYCDAAVDFYKKYDENDPLELDVDEIPYSGGGGTSFDPPFEYIEENDIAVDAMIYLTDGYGPCTVKKPQFPVLWLISKDGTDDFCSWGKKIWFKESSWD